ncbi:MAG: outer membrane beta-barrel protein [Bacteroidetes bacterium]|nr:outer membrane beta-barrel protein [Bacteroidota bacterium]
MKKSLTLFLISVACFLNSQAQTASIKGNLLDSNANIKMANAVVALVRPSDSVLIAYTRSDANGNFLLNKVDAGNYKLLITYPEYADYTENVILDPNQQLNISAVYLTQMAKILQEIIIKQAAIRIKGDTTEFTADSFHVKPNATVEDLLKELPGVQVDKNGQVTAMGQKVQKVLVDGEEFFSDDPTVATRNLRADAIDKVQVFEKKSDQAAFTGIDDGQKTQTINLKLKANAKHGYFGKVSIAGLDKYYNGQALINAFKGNRKISAFVIASSTDQLGLDFQDARSYGFGGDNIQIDGGSGAVIGSNSTDDFGTTGNYGQGLPESIKGGLHYSNKWNNNKDDANGNYLFNRLAQRTSGNTFTQNILKDSVYYNRENANTHSTQMRNSISGTFETQIDSSSSIKFTGNGYAGTLDNTNEYHSEALSQENNLVNSSNRTTSQKGDNANGYFSALYRKKFKKKGRTLSINADEKYTESNTNGYLFNASNFYNNIGALIKKDTTDQNKKNNTEVNVAGAKATYTEPLSAKSYLEINYSFYNNVSTQKKLSYSLDGNAKYTVLVDSLSNEFKYIYNTNSAGLNYLFNGKKIIFSTGGNIANTAFTQSDLFKDTARKYSYYNFFPRASFTYRFSSFSNLRINYSGSTTQPTIDQLQPLKNNLDPLNIVVGNPDLKQQFQHSFSILFSKFQLLNERFLFLSSNLTFTHDPISNSYTIDNFGRRVSKYINTDGSYSANLFGGYSMKIPKSILRLGLGPTLNISHYSNLINNVKNNTNSTTLGMQVSLRMDKKDKFQLNLSAEPMYNQSKSSISTISNMDYWTFNYNVDGNVQLPGKLELGSSVDFNLRQKVNAFDQNNNVILWNGYLEKKFMKSEALTLRASINDILDQNKGYNRVVQPSSIQESRYLTFRRYGLITLTYNFNNKGGSPPPKGRAMIL